MTATVCELRVHADELVDWCRAHGFVQGWTGADRVVFDWRTIRVIVPEVGTTAVHVFDASNDWETVWSAHVDETTPFDVVKACVVAAMVEEGGA